MTFATHSGRNSGNRTGGQSTAAATIIEKLDYDAFAQAYKRGRWAPLPVLEKEQTGRETKEGVINKRVIRRWKSVNGNLRTGSGGKARDVFKRAYARAWPAHKSIADRRRWK